jgi:formyl-CoA transferase
VAEKLGVTYERMSALNPRLVYAHATGYGELGNEAEKPGYDATAWWARSGLMDLIRDAGADPALSMPGMGDHAGAMALFGGIMLALYQRDRTGRGTKVSSSLMANGVWANGFLSQAVLCGAKALRPATRRDTKNALANRYRTRDGRWLFLAVILEDRDWPRVPPALGHPDLTSDPRFATTAARHANALTLVELLDGVFAEKTLEEWRTILDRHEITFGVVAELADLANDPQMACNDVFVELDLGERGKGRTINSPVWLAGAHKVPAREAPAIGQHTDEVLRALGYDSAQIGRLRQSKAVA